MYLLLSPVLINSLTTIAYCKDDTIIWFGLKVINLIVKLINNDVDDMVNDEPFI